MWPCSLRGPSLVTQILLCLPTALFLGLQFWSFLVFSFSCLLKPSEVAGWHCSRANPAASYSLTRKVRTQTEGTECEISTLLPAPQPREGSCFHCVEAGHFPKVDPGKGWEGARGLQPCPLGTLPALSLPSTPWGGYLRESPSCWTTEHLSLSHSLGKELFFSPALSKMQISWLCYKSHAGEADREVAPGWIWPYPFADPPASCVFLTQRLAQNYPFYKTPHFSVYKTALLCISSCFPQKP